MPFDRGTCDSHEEKSDECLDSVWANNEDDMDGRKNGDRPEGRCPMVLAIMRTPKGTSEANRDGYKTGKKPVCSSRKRGPRQSIGGSEGETIIDRRGLRGGNGDAFRANVHEYFTGAESRR